MRRRRNAGAQWNFISVTLPHGGCDKFPLWSARADGNAEEKNVICAEKVLKEI